ncbi:hypothetical protein F3Y22_tig00110570pilonHSYRG00126 [Hibiscus syriacus]|uniref:Uncharacterized protein n=1 Tax=Hibiscus syriacus TaxID=106335 RepID=A0A6A3A5Y3_HIBSY|nr:hypothetical protein F3Y22_tig00110570pilonHSYRG00126 [Hibiscus syriacus]
MTNQQLMYRGNQMMDETDQAIGRLRTLAETEKEQRPTDDCNQAVENENEADSGLGNAGNQWWGIIKEIQMIVFGFITSLLTSFNNIGHCTMLGSPTASATSISVLFMNQHALCRYFVVEIASK